MIVTTINLKSKRKDDSSWETATKTYFFCPSCNGFYQSEQKRVFCPNCNTFCKKLAISDNDFCAFSSEEKERFRKECKQRLNEHDANNRIYREFKPRTRINIVYWMGTFVMIACVIAGCAAGPLGLLGGIIGGVASMTCIWLFAGMAEDLQTMRQTVEDLSDTLYQIQREQKNN